MAPGKVILATRKCLTMKKPKLRNILVPIDFSPVSIEAIEHAKKIAQKFDATIGLAHVHHQQYAVGYLGPVLARGQPVMSFEEHRLGTLGDELKEVACRAGLPPSTQIHVCVGPSAFHEICRLAQKISTDLIVMSTHGRTGLKHFFLGSTAERILQHSPCPVLVTRPRVKTLSRPSVHGSALRSIDTILVPVDFSQTSFQALEYAVEFAERVAARLILFHAVDLGPALTADGYAMYDMTAMEKAAQKGAEEQMQKFVRLAKFQGVHFETLVRVAQSISEICNLAEQRDVDLIITATHGRTGFKHLLIGSVAEQVVRYAPRSVLVVPSHPDIRIARLTGATQKAQARLGQHTTKQKSPEPPLKLTKTKRKVTVHPLPERRLTNKFRESHMVRENSASNKSKR